MKKIAAIVAALLCSACASTADQTNEASGTKAYRTGSNLPVRDRSGSSDSKTVDVESIEDLRRRSGTRSLGTP
jgi:hypothetical protein